MQSISLEISYRADITSTRSCPMQKITVKILRLQEAVCRNAALRGVVIERKTCLVMGVQAALLLGLRRT